jgi:hypothetical protein
VDLTESMLGLWIHRVLLYLNKDWEPEFDGSLLIRTDPAQEPRASSGQDGSPAYGS